MHELLQPRGMKKRKNVHFFQHVLFKEFFTCPLWWTTYILSCEFDKWINNIHKNKNILKYILNIFYNNIYKKNITLPPTGRTKGTVLVSEWKHERWMCTTKKMSPESVNNSEHFNHFYHFFTTFISFSLSQCIQKGPTKSTEGDSNL